MKNGQQTKKERILEVEKDGFRRLIHRITKADGSVFFMEETDLIDFSRPISATGDFNVYFTERAFWKAFVRFTSREGLLNRQVWHESAKEWLGLDPLFIHSDLKHLVQNSLAEVTRELSSDGNPQIEGIRKWLRKLAQPQAVVKETYMGVGKNITNLQNTYRHAV